MFELVEVSFRSLKTLGESFEMSFEILELGEVSFGMVHLLLGKLISVTVRVKRGHFLRFWFNK